MWNSKASLRPSSSHVCVCDSPPTPPRMLRWIHVFVPSSSLMIHWHTLCHKTGLYTILYYWLVWSWWWYRLFYIAWSQRNRSPSSIILCINNLVNHNQRSFLMKKDVLPSLEYRQQNAKRKQKKKLVGYIWWNKSNHEWE